MRAWEASTGRIADGGTLSYAILEEQGKSSPGFVLRDFIHRQKLTADQCYSDLEEPLGAPAPPPRPGPRHPGNENRRKWLFWPESVRRLPPLRVDLRRSGAAYRDRRAWASARRPSSDQRTSCEPLRGPREHSLGIQVCRAESRHPRNEV